MLASCNTDWQQRLGNLAHGSRSIDATITAANVPQLSQKWRFTSPTSCPNTGGTAFWSTPVTFHGVIYEGTDRGCLYAIDEATAQVKWFRFMGYVPITTCGQSLGIVSSAVVQDDGSGNPVVYQHAPDGYLYKLDGRDGSVIWKSLVRVPSNTVNDVYAWSSPTVANGKVYIGVSSNCDLPFVQGQVRAYDASTGQLLWVHKTIPDVCPNPVPAGDAQICPNTNGNNGCVGAGDWYDAAVDSAGNVYVSTGSTCDSVGCGATTNNHNDGYEEYSLLKLNGDTGALIWKAPNPMCTGDPDLASSPVLFTGNGVPLVGASNKDGWFRVYRQDNGQPVWEAYIGLSTSSSSPLSGGVWDGTHLFVAGNQNNVGNWQRNSAPCDPGFSSCWKTVGGTTVPGSIREFDPATGALAVVGGQPFELPMPVAIEGPCSINGNGILACGGGHVDVPPGHDNGLYLIDTTQAPAILRHLEDPVINAWDFAQPVFENSAILFTDVGSINKWSAP
jgi:outer membrane protein assembly factor BamB